MRDRHRDALLALAERERQAALTPRQPEVFVALDPEAANLAGALDRAIETDPDKALRMCLALDFWYRARARFREADNAYGRALGASWPAPALRARALGVVGVDPRQHGRLSRANELAAEAAARAEASGDAAAVATTLLVLGNHSMFTDPIAPWSCWGAAATSRTPWTTSTSSCARRRCCAARPGPAGRDRLPGGARRARRSARAPRGSRDARLVLVLAGRDALPAGRARTAAAAARQGGRRGGRDRRGDRRSRCADVPRAASTSRPAGPRSALEQMLDISAQTLLHGGSFAFAWIELLVAQAEACCDRLQAAGARLESLVNVDAWGMTHALAWAQAELAEVLRLLGEDDEAIRHGTRAVETAGRLAEPLAGREGAAHARPARRAARRAGAGRAPAPRRARDDLGAPLPPRAAERAGGAGGGGGRPREPYRSGADPGGGRAACATSSGSSRGPPSARRSPRSRRAWAMRWGRRRSNRR